MNRLQADAVAELVHWGGAGGLSELDLSSNPLQETGVSILLEAETLGNLNRLDLQETGLRGAGASQLAASTHFPRLTELRLAYQLLDEQGHAFSAAQKTLIERRFGAHVCHFTAAH